MTDRDDGLPSERLRALPETYALALRLWAEGLDDAAIARVLDIEVESVAPLLTLARAKLANLDHLDQPFPPPTTADDATPP